MPLTIALCSQPAGRAGTSTSRRGRPRPGMTLTELMVAMAIMTIGVLGMVGAFKYFNVGVQSAKTRSLANNIAQERIEYLKNKSYYRVLVTTASASDPNYAAGEMIYDVAPNGEETVNVGGINFLRRVYIRKVSEDPSGNLSYMSWNSPDPGLKEIKVYVCWFERGEWRKLEVRNLRENPARVNRSATISGHVGKSGGGNVSDVVIRAQEDPSYYGESDASGNYSFSIVAGTYTLLATKNFYFPSVLPSFGVGDGATVSGKDFTLTQMSTGSISGYAFLRDRLMISSIVGSTSTGTGDTEWIEVYNPTTWTWTMATGLGIGANEVINFSYKEKTGAVVTPDIDYRTAALVPGHYYLFSNTGTVSAAGVTVQADAVYSSNGDWLHQDDVITVDDMSAYVSLRNNVTSRVYDTVGWMNYDPVALTYQYPDSYEMWPVFYWQDWKPLDHGMKPNRAFLRNTWFGQVLAGQASCFDVNYNYYDVMCTTVTYAPPRTSTGTQTCVTGGTGEGAIVFVDDGLSSPVTASWAGYYYISPVSTGSWTVYMSSGVSFSSVAYYGGTTSNYSSWSGYNVMSSPTIYGYITGRVTDVLGNNLSSIKMYAPGTSPVYTNASGRYTLPVEAGVVTVRANYQSYSPSYVELSSADINVAIGQAQQNVNFALYQGGRIRGRVTTNGVDPLPGIPVTGIKGGVEQGSGVSDDDGYFIISGTGISTGTYVVQPQLEVGEGCSPSSKTVTVTAGVTTFSSTFTVSNAFGAVEGQVTKSSEAITTGVLVYVTTATLAAGATPPDITSALRAGTAVYYADSSNALGNFSISVKGGYSYNVYAWYTTWSNSVPVVTRKQSLGVAVNPNQTVTVNFNW